MEAKLDARKKAMNVFISEQLLRGVHTHGEEAYPEEGAGLLLGQWHDMGCVIEGLFPVNNAREAQARHNRYLLTPQDFWQGEQEASRLGMEVVGVFHSHPDHPSRPSDFDREWALPHLVYLITSVHEGKAEQSKAWLLDETRQNFTELKLLAQSNTQNGEHP